MEGSDYRSSICVSLGRFFVSGGILFCIAPRIFIGLLNQDFGWSAGVFDAWSRKVFEVEFA